jgi:hypothetical protein
VARALEGAPGFWLKRAGAARNLRAKRPSRLPVASIPGAWGVRTPAHTAIAWLLASQARNRDPGKPQSISIPRWRRAMERCVVPLAEAMPVILRCLRRHGRVAEARMTVDIVRFSRLHVPPSRIIAIVKGLLGNRAEHRRRRRLGRYIHRLRMRTSSHGKREQ